MKNHLWRVGIELQERQMFAVALQSQKAGWLLQQWWHFSFKQPIQDEMTLADNLELVQALITIKQQLPRRHSVRTLLADVSVLQHESVLPAQSLSEQELAWFVEAIIKTHFPFAAAELAIDYRANGDGLITVTAARKTIIDSYTSLFKKAMLTLDIIDIKSSIRALLLERSQLSELELNSIQSWSSLNINCSLEPPKEIASFNLACGLALRWSDR